MWPTCDQARANFSSMSSNLAAKLSHVTFSLAVAKLSMVALASLSKWSMAGLTCSACTASNLGKPEKCKRGLWLNDVADTVVYPYSAISILNAGCCLILPAAVQFFLCQFALKFFALGP